LVPGKFLCGLLATELTEVAPVETFLVDDKAFSSVESVVWAD